MANIQEIRVTQSGAEQTSRQLNKVDRSIAGMTSSALKYAAAAGAVVTVLKKSIDAAGVQEQAEKRLEVALGRTSTALLKQASALQKVSTFGDETIIGVQASIAAFVDSEKAIAAATAATLDLAAATGMDLKAAGDLVAKSLGSRTNALSRYGIEVAGAVGSSERLNSLTGNIADKFGGQAAAAAETMAGKMSQATNAIGDAAEALGEVFIEPVTLAAQGIKWLSEGLESFIDSVSKVDTGIMTLEERFALINATVRDHADLSIPELQAAYTAIGNSYDENASRGSNFLRLLQEQDEAFKALIPDIAVSNEGVDSMTEGYEDLSTELDAVIAKFEALIPLQKKTADTQEQVGATAEEASIQALAMSDDLATASLGLANRYIVEGVFAATKSALASVPFPANILAAGAAAAGANALFNSIIPTRAAATGADFVTNGPQMLLVGDNSTGREHVSVTPLGGEGGSGGGGVNIYLNGPVIGSQEFVENELIPSINRAVTQGRAALA